MTGLNDRDIQKLFSVAADNLFSNIIAVYNNAPPYKAINRD